MYEGQLWNLIEMQKNTTIIINQVINRTCSSANHCSQLSDQPQQSAWNRLPTELRLPLLSVVDWKHLLWTLRVDTGNQGNRLMVVLCCALGLLVGGTKVTLLQLQFTSIHSVASTNTQKLHLEYSICRVYAGRSSCGSVASTRMHLVKTYKAVSRVIVLNAKKDWVNAASATKSVKRRNGRRVVGTAKPLNYTVVRRALACRTTDRLIVVNRLNFVRMTNWHVHSTSFILFLSAVVIAAET